MEIPSDKNFRHLLYFAFCHNQEAAEAARDIFAVCGEGAMSAKTARDWFARFGNRNFFPDNIPRSGRSADLGECVFERRRSPHMQRRWKAMQ